MIGELVSHYLKHLPYELLESAPHLGLVLYRDTGNGHIIFGRNGVVFNEINNLSVDDARFSFQNLVHRFEEDLI